MTQDEDIKITLKQVSALVAQLVEPVSEALTEIQRARNGRIITTAIITAMVIISVAVDVFVVRANQRLVVAVDRLKLTQLAQKVEVTMTSEQIERLIGIAKDEANTDVAKARLDEIQAIRQMPAAALDEINEAAEALEAAP